jgi:hypothetical protein
MHFVQYHNTEKMGYSYRHEDGEPFSILTNKPVSGLLGSTIWLIAGEGRPRSYFLVCRFEVDDIGEADHAYFKHFASGTNGRAFEPIPVNGLDWFEKIYSQTRNFSLGLSKLDDEVVAEMERLVKESRP